MRIRLKKGKQQKLIHLAKQNITWKELSKKLNLCEGYLRNELKKEKRLISDEAYYKLCEITKVNFDKDIVQRLKENWGKSKGGINSPKNLKTIKIPIINENLAEVIGIILGDGHVEEFKKGKKIRCYSIKIAGNADTDKDFLTNYIPQLFKKVFNEKGKINLSNKSKVGYYTIYGKNFVEFIKLRGIKSGNKQKNNQGIPNWIFKNNKYLKACIRGLIDTDGSVHYISKNNKNLRISYTSHISNLLSNVRNGLIKLGFNPSKIIKDRQIFLSSKEDVNNYIKKIGFGNRKNLNRFNLFKTHTPP